MSASTAWAHDHPTMVELTPTEHAWLAAHPDIRLGTDENRAPYVRQQKEDTLVGVEPDLLARINALTGANIRLVVGQWATIVQQAERGELEGLAISTAQPEREAHFSFTSSPYSMTRYIYTRGGTASPFHSMVDLVGKKVGVQRGVLVAQKILARWPGITVVPKDCLWELNIALINGEVDAVLESIALQNVLQEELFSVIGIAFVVPVGETPTLYSIRKEYPELLSIFNKALAAMTPAEIQKILDHWSANDTATFSRVTLTAAEKAWLAAHPDIRLGSGRQFWPYIQPQENGEIVGIEPDILARINALTGAKIRLVLGQWEEIVKQAEHSELDGLAMSTVQPERAVHFSFSTSIYNTSRYIYTRGGPASPIRSMTDLAGKKVGMWRGILVDQKLLAQWPGIIPVPLDSPQALGPALANGEVDALLFPIVLRKFLRDAGYHSLDIAFAVPNSETPTVYSIHKDYPELLSIINKALTAIGPAEIHKILVKWGTVYELTHPMLAPVTLTKGEQDWLNEHPKIVLGISDQFQPEIVVGVDGSHSGLLVDYFKLLNKILGNRLQFHVESKWQAVTDKAMRREIDGLASSTPNPTWDQYFLYTQPYYHGYFHFYTRADASAVPSLKNLASQRVGYLTGIKKIEYLLQQFPQLTPVPLESNEAMAKALAEERVNVVIARMDFEWWRRQSSHLTMKINGFIPESRHPVVMSIRNDWPLLPAIINKALNAIPVVERERIRQRWLGGAEPAAESPLALRVSAEERDYLNNTTFQRSISADWMPFSFKDKQGMTIGLSEDYWALIRDKLGVRETVTGIQSISQILQALQQGKTDLHISTSRIRERESYLVFSDSYDQYPIAIATRQSAGFFSNVAALENQIVAVGKNYTAYYLLKARYPTIRFLEVKDTATALAEVANGNAFAAVDVLPALQYQLAQFHHDNVVLAGVSDVQFPLQIAVRKEHARLIPLINQAIALITPDERFKIQQKWMQRSVITAPDYALLWQLIGAAVLIIAVILYWNRRLTKEIALRKYTEQQLQHTTGRLHSILDSMDDLVFVIDANGHFLDSYQKHPTSLIVPSEQFLGKHYREILPKSVATLTDQALAVIQEKGTQHYDYSLTMADGNEHWFNASLSARYNSDSQFSGTTAVVRDVTERHLIEQALRDSEARLRTLSDNLPNGLIYQIDSGVHGKIRRFTYISAGVEKLHGVSVETTLNDAKHIYSQILAEDATHLSALESQAFATMTPLRAEVRCQLPNGHISWRLFTSAPQRLTNGHVIWDGVEIDITDRKHAELELQLAWQRQHAAEQFARETIDALGAHLCVLDETGKIILVNRAWRQFADANGGSFNDYGIGCNYLDYCQFSTESDHNKASFHFYKQLQRVLQGEIDHFDFEYACHSPTVKHWFIAHITRFATVPLRVVIAHENITARKHAEEALRRSQIRYQRLVDDLSPNFVVYSHDADGVLEYVSNGMETIFGISPAQAVGHNLADIVPWKTYSSQDLFIHINNMSLTSKENLTSAQFELNFSRSDGSVGAVLITAHRAKDFDSIDNVTIRGIIEDITERKHAEEALRRSDTRYRSLITAMAEGVVMQNRAGEIVECNVAAERILGLTKEQMMGRTSLDPRWRAIREDGSPFPGDEHPLPTVLRTGRAQHRVTQGIHKPEGELRWILVNAEPLFQVGDKQPYAAVATFTDITDSRTAMQKVDEQRRTLQTVLDHLPAGVQVFAAPNAQPLLANNQAHLLLGQEIIYTDIDRLNTHYSVYIYGTETPYPSEKMPLVRALQGEVSMVEDMELRRRDGSKTLLQVIGAPIFDSEYHITSSVVIFQDITARKHAESELQANQAKFARIAATVPGVLYDYILYPDGSNRFSYISPRCRELFEIEDTALLRDINLFWNMVHPEDVVRLIKSGGATKRRGDYFHDEVRIITPSGQLKWIAIDSRPNPVEPGQPILWSGHVIDITVQKQVEAALIEARQAAEVANRAKSTFVANMSHELRTPLNAILGFAQILRQDASLSELQRNQIHSIHRGGEYLLTLINDILDLAKIESGHFDLFPAIWDTHSVFQEIDYMFRIRTEHKGIYYHHEHVTPLPQSLYCDDKRLRQILINLLGNAVKFTEHGGVTLRTGYTTGNLWLEVVDSGIGIATADIDKIFEPFQQTGTDRYKVQGTGLGLAITHRLVQTMGGTLQVASTIDEGSVFRVDVPVEAVSTAIEAESTGEQLTVIGYHRNAGIGPLRVLTVDDLSENRLVLRYLLEPLGFEVAEAENGRRCIDTVPYFQPDVILMDLRMPEMDGVQAMQVLRERGFNMPIIVVSASAFADDRVASLKAGCAAHLSKPLHLAELFDVLAKLLPLTWEYLGVVGAIAEDGAVEILSIEHLARFLHLVKMGDIQSLKEFAEEIEASYPRFAKELLKLVKAFKIREIFDLARRYDSEAV